MWQNGNSPFFVADLLTKQLPYRTFPTPATSAPFTFGLLGKKCAEQG